MSLDHGPALELASCQFGVVSRIQLLSLGMSEHSIERRVSSGDLMPLHPGVFAVGGTAPSHDRDLMAATVWSTGHLSHRAAAERWQLPIPQSGLIEISTTRALKAPGVIVHRRAPLPQCDLSVVSGIPATAVHRTLLDLGSLLYESSVEIALDDALRRGVVTLPQLRWHLARVGGRGVRGTAKLRRILDARGLIEGTRESPLETITNRLFRGSVLPMPLMQQKIYDGSEFLGRVDFYYPEPDIAIEVLGWKWHHGKRQWEFDMRRRSYLWSRGTVVLEFSWADVTQRPEWVVETIQRSFLLEPRQTGVQKKRTG